ncbi:unnamed protein product [Euphydryas editha]|uniref:Reverse transcriptase domain-containing protein n=1 Tax=Euphydryas editha TaxID=104508 RepID=A0AAU9VDS9_EUPED|nr:unnamed protein product [Euphydryas editha]
MATTGRLKPRSLSVVSFNANGLMPQIGQVRQFLRDYPVDVMLVQETFLKPSIRDPKIANYHLIRNDRVDACGGTVIYYKKSLHCVPIDPPPLSCIEVSMCRVSLTGHQPVTLASMYLSPSKSLLESDIRSLLSTGSSVLLAGDLNSKHYQWNSRSINTKGRELDRLTSLPSLDFEVIAPQTPTRFPFRNSNDRPDVLDIAILRGVTLQLRTIETLSELDSDHRPVLIKLGPDTELTHPTKIVVDWKKLDTELQSTDSFTLNRIPDTIDTVDAAIAAADNLTSFIKDKIDGCSREIPIRPGARWELPEELKDLIRRKNAQIRAHDTYPTDDNRRQLRALQREVKARFAELRDDLNSRRFGELTPSHTTYWTLAKRLRCDTVASTPPLLRQNLPPALDDRDKAECLADHLESQCSPSTHPVDPSHLSKVNEEVERRSSLPLPDEPLPPTSVDEVESIVKKLHSKKSPGPDRITNKTVKRLPSQLLMLLVMIYNSLLAGCSFPDQWKEAIVIGIQKPGKPGNLPSSYRPISLLNSLGKVYERIILIRLKQAMERMKPPLINEQFGFRTNHSSVHQVHRITEHILRGFAISRSRTTGAVFFDIAKAFDKVWHNGLVFKLYQYGLPDRLVRIIRDYLSNRTFRYRVEGTLSSPRQIRAGVPQGSVLSPTLFSLYTNDIPIPAESTATKLALFADDTALFTTSTSMELLTRRLQFATDALSAWFKKWRFEVNADKSAAVHFVSNPRYTLWRQGLPDPVKLNGTPIPWQKEVKYLGVTLDSKLSFKSHINRVRNKARFVLSRLYVMICGRSKMSLRNKLTLYKTCVRPIMTYASPVFAHCKPAYIQRLQVIQNRFLRTATASPWFVRNIDLHKDFRIDSIAKHLKMLSTVYFEKARHHPNPLVANACHYVGRGQFQTRQRRPMHVLTDPDDRMTLLNAPFLGTTNTSHTHRLRRRRRGPRFLTIRTRLGA